MINKRMSDALNAQIKEEMFSAYLYLSMSAFFEAENLKGFANWMRVQAQEEQFHAMKIFDYLNERGAEVELLQIDKPKNKWESVLEVFEETLAHEEFITSRINNLVDIAIEERDHATKGFLQWYVDEQVEEEATANEYLDQLRFIGDNKHALMLLEREMRSRVFTPPTAE